MNIFKSAILILALTQVVGCAGTAAQKEQRFDGVTDLGLAAGNMAQLDLGAATIYGLNGTMKVFLSYTTPSQQAEAAN